MDKYGFIYVWRDRKRNKFYIGCHWGTEDDGYICSSTVMRKAYRRRPEDFKRRIIQRIYSTRQELLEVEHRWLTLVPDEQLGKRYYNMSKHHFNHWSAMPDEERKKTIRQKISAANLGKVLSEETRARISAATLGRKKKNLKSGSRYISPETRAKMVESRLRNGNYKMSDATRLKQSRAKLGNQNRKQNEQH